MSIESIRDEKANQHSSHQEGLDLATLGAFKDGFDAAIAHVKSEGDGEIGKLSIAVKALEIFAALPTEEGGYMAREVLEKIRSNES